ncbi:hypothetical protein ACLOJK_038530 [Asimina triloba]
MAAAGKPNQQDSFHRQGSTPAKPGWGCTEGDIQGLLSPFKLTEFGSRPFSEISTWAGYTENESSEVGRQKLYR